MDQKKEKAMFSWKIQKMLPLTIAAAVSCLIAPHQVSAANADVTFTASGTFASIPLSGADTLKLAGQPFTISVVGNSSLQPIQHGPNWAIFKPLAMTGVVYSGLLGPEPIDISATTAAIDQAVGPTEDIFQSGFPVNVIGIALTARAYFILPAGTLTNPLLRPFASVTLAANSSTTTVSYSNGTATTVLEIANGTLVATIPPPSGSVAHAALATPFGGHVDHFLRLDEVSALAPSKAVRIQFE